MAGKEEAGRGRAIGARGVRSRLPCDVTAQCTFLSHRMGARVVVGVSREVGRPEGGWCWPLRVRRESGPWGRVSQEAEGRCPKVEGD